MHGTKMSRVYGCIRKAHQQVVLNSTVHAKQRYMTSNHFVPPSVSKQSSRCHFYCTTATENSKSSSDPDKFIVSSSDLTAGINYSESDSSSTTLKPDIQALPVPPKGKINTVQNGKVTAVKPRELYQDIKYMYSADVLATLAASYGAMDKVHFAVCLKRLATIHGKLYGQEQVEFQEATYADERFQVLCALITRKSRFYEPSITFDMFTFMRIFGFSDEHPAIQTFLQLLKHHLNELHLGQLIDLADETRGMSRTKNTELISQGISVLASRRTHEITALSLTQKMVLLDLFSNVLPEKWQDLVWEKMVDELQESELTFDQVPMLLRVMSKTGISDQSIEELCVATAEQHLPEYTTWDLLGIVKTLHDITLYCPDLLNDIAGNFLSPMTRLSDQLDLLKCFCDQSHAHSDLMDSVLHSVVDNDCSAVELREAIECLAALRAQPLSQDMAMVLSVKLNQKLDDVASDLDLVSSALALGLEMPPGTYGERLVSTTTPAQSEGDVLRLETQYRPPAHGGYTVTQEEAVGVLRCHGVNIELPHSNIQREKVSQESRNYKGSFSLFLKRAFPEVHIKECCVLESGLTADYCMDLSNKLHLPHSARVAVKVLPPAGFTRNHYTLKGFPRLYMCALQKLGYTVIVVNPMKWSDIPERERSAYLQHKIANFVRQDPDDIHIL